MVFALASIGFLPIITLQCMQCQSKVRWRFREILWLSQNTYMNFKRQSFDPSLPSYKWWLIWGWAPPFGAPRLVCEFQNGEWAPVCLRTPFRGTCRLFQISYGGYFWYLCTVTFWQKVDFLISNACQYSNCRIYLNVKIHNFPLKLKTTLIWL